LKDIDEFIGFVAKDSQIGNGSEDAEGKGKGKCKTFLMGHSMGGQQVLCHMLASSTSSSSSSSNNTFTPQNRHLISGLLLEAPYVAMHPSSAPFAITVFAGRLAARVVPNMQMVQKLDPKYMSRDQKVVDDWVADKLNHDTGTFEGLKGMLARAAGLVGLSEKATLGGKGGKKDRRGSALGRKTEFDADTGLRISNTLSVPLWCSHGSGDRVVSYDASLKLWRGLEIESSTSSFAETKASKDSEVEKRDGKEIITGCNGLKTYVTYVDAYHKLHAEPNDVGASFATDVAEWIRARTPFETLVEAVNSEGDNITEQVAKNESAVEGEGMLVDKAKL